MRAEAWTGYAAIPRLLRYPPGLRKPSELLIHASLYQRMPTELKVGFMALTVNWPAGRDRLLTLRCSPSSRHRDGQQRVDGCQRAAAADGQLTGPLPTCRPRPHVRGPHWPGLAAPLPAARSTSTSTYRSTLNLNVPRKLMCEKCAGPIRRSQSSSIPTPSRLSRATTLSMRLVFQASTNLVSSVRA